MSLLHPWFQTHITPANRQPLFATVDGVVQTQHQGTRRVVTRHPAFDQLMITTVEQGLADDTWSGLLYVLHWGSVDAPVPLYIGKAERRGRIHPLSANLRNIRTNHGFFGRWGYRPAYHIGDLSLALFGGQTYKTADPKYRRWAQRLFTTIDPPTLVAPTFVALVSWHAGMRGPSGLIGSVAAVEKELIALASVEHATTLLNQDGI